MSIEATTWVWAQDLPAGAKLVALGIADHADKTGFCWPGAEGLADKCKVAQRTVWRQIGELERLGVLCRTRRSSQAGRRSNSYQLHLMLDECQFCNVTYSVSQRDTNDVSNVTPRPVALEEVEPSIESPEESSIETQQLLDPSTRPEWWGLGVTLKRWTIEYEVAHNWAHVDNDYSDEYLTRIMYRFRAWWGEKQIKAGRDAYASFQAAVRDKWGEDRQAVGTGRPTRPSGERSAAELKEAQARLGGG